MSDIDKTCPSCNAELENESVECPSCGFCLDENVGDATPDHIEQVANAPDFCSKCGAQLTEEQVFCSKCGQKVKVAESDGNKFNDRPLIIGAVAVILIAALAMLINSSSAFDFNKEFADIADEDWCKIADDGSYMEIDTNPFDMDGDIAQYTDAASDAIQKIKEVNKTLGFSSALYEKMGATTSLQGRQSDENKKIKVSWTYHPDKGLEVMYEKN